MATALLFGATGLVGAETLKLLISQPAFATVQTICRRAPKSESAKLAATVEVDNTKWAATLASLSPKPSVVISALGTTRAQAGGVEQQRAIDETLNLELARAARDAGVQGYVFVSSAGTSSGIGARWPYGQMKQAVEKGLKEMDFPAGVAILRPGMILGKREVGHLGGGIISGAIGLVGRVAGQGAADKFGQDATVIARAVITAARMVEEGKAPEKFWVLEQADVVRLGRTEWKD